MLEVFDYAKAVASLFTIITGIYGASRLICKSIQNNEKFSFHITVGRYYKINNAFHVQISKNPIEYRGAWIFVRNGKAAKAKTTALPFTVGSGHVPMFETSVSDEFSKVIRLPSDFCEFVVSSEHVPSKSDDVVIFGLVFPKDSVLPVTFRHELSSFFSR